jgi:hypothetical protein
MKTLHLVQNSRKPSAVHPIKSIPKRLPVGNDGSDYPASPWRGYCAENQFVAVAGPA